MLGAAVLTPYHSVEDFKSPADYLSYMFGDKKGFFSYNLIRGEKFVERFVKRNGMLTKKFSGVEDCYISQNSFLSPASSETPSSGRNDKNLKRLNALYADIDCYNAGYTKTQSCCHILDTCHKGQLPWPTFVIDSGRGLYLIWKIDEDRNALPRWRAVEQHLIQEVEKIDVGVDTKASDPSRILRVPGTINSKNGSMVRIVWFNNVQYKLNELIKEYDIPSVKAPQGAQRRHIRPDGLLSHPYGQATERQRKAARWIADTLSIPLPDFSNFDETAAWIERNLPQAEQAPKKTKRLTLGKGMSIQSILAGRMADLRKLFSMRKGEDCCREMALFLYRHWHLTLNGDPQMALEETLLFNSQLDRPFTEVYVAKATESAEKKYKKGRTYNYTTKKIIADLRITPEEQRELKYLCNMPANAKEQKSKANRRGYLSRLEKTGKTTKGASIAERREKIAAMLADGESKAAICHALNISGRTFDRDKAAVKEAGLVEKILAARETAAQEATAAAEGYDNCGNDTKVEQAKEACSARFGMLFRLAKWSFDALRVLSPFFQRANYKKKQSSALPLITRHLHNLYRHIRPPWLVRWLELWRGS